ncbi:hypothetical protein XarjCFBP7645_08730 [Xanthomonas arboricola]|uniref:Uncharacterized protein n=1 Tax=Xanthomonas arboricola TaxID=56448 RepID=A0A2S7ADD0_9XANT|nr:hypothetical protein XarjCFBP7645_08730 [Xanthomonas arboricola]
MRALQVAVRVLVLTGIGVLLGVTPPLAFVAVSGVVPTSTAVLGQLAEPGDVAWLQGHKSVQPCRR